MGLEQHLTRVVQSDPPLYCPACGRVVDALNFAGGKPLPCCSGVNHRYKVGQHLWWPDPLGFPRYLGEIVALFAPGNYFVRRFDGCGCITTEDKLNEAGVVVNDTGIQTGILFA